MSGCHDPSQAPGNWTFAVESRLALEIQARDARISALRDALEACLRHPTFMHRTVTEIMDAALRADDEAAK